MLVRACVRVPGVVMLPMARRLALHAKHARVLSSLARATGEEGAAVYPMLGVYKPAMLGGTADSMPRYPSASSSGLLRLADYVGTGAFAMSGAITASTVGMDLFGTIPSHPSTVSYAAPRLPRNPGSQ